MIVLGLLALGMLGAVGVSRVVLGKREGSDDGDYPLLDLVE